MLLSRLSTHLKGIRPVHAAHSFDRGSIVRHASTQTRSPAYAELSEADISYFRDLLGPHSIVTDSNLLETINSDWMKRYHGSSKLAIKPTTTQQVSDILRYCNSKRLAVVPQAGNSGLCGGSVPLFDEVVLLTSGLDNVISFDAVSGALTCQAGCTLGFLGQFAGERSFTIPLDLGAKECQAGGFVSTNAGGLRLLRYGSLRGTVLGLEAVLADGTVLDLLEPVRKNNTGYDLKQLFIGGEGTLGIVTAVSILCPPKSSSVHLSYLACNSYQDVQKVFGRARQQLGEILSAFEFLDKHALDLTLGVLKDSVKNPLPASHTPFYLLIETAGGNREHDHAKLQAFLESVSEEGLIAGSAIAQTSQQMGEMWYLREHISVALSTKGPVYKYDLSLPVKEIYGLVEATRERLKAFPEAEVVAYGHIGDGNLHLNISVPQYNQAVLDAIEPFVYEYTAMHKGSISAEHGLGQMKNEYIGYSKPENAIAIMAQLKRMFDPNSILNPYKFLPRDVRERNEDLQIAAHA